MYTHAKRLTSSNLRLRNTEIGQPRVTMCLPIVSQPRSASYSSSELAIWASKLAIRWLVYCTHKGQGSEYRFSRTVFFNAVVVKLVSVLVT